ncbi:MAG: glycosyltransferase family 4 protein, partial [Campylobacterales bacterium]|nr:glycosyltransferase family 4 protein [Campylobacterales bacterium]
LKLAKIIDTYQIDIVHFHWNKDILTVVLGRFLSQGKPKIIMSRHMGMTRFKNDFYHKWLYNNIDTIHAVTKKVASELERYIPQDVRPNIKMIYLGVSEPTFDNNKVQQLKNKYQLSNQFVVGIVGRIQDGKGQHLVIDAINYLKELNIKALIIGHTMDEEYLHILKNKVQTLNLQDKVIFTGFTNEVNEHMQLCNATVLATQNETFGLVVIESMVNKKCVIATNNGGPLEIIDDGIDGLLFDRTSEDLAQKIQKLYNNLEYKNQLSIKAKEKALVMFDKNTQLAKLYEVLENM